MKKITAAKATQSLAEYARKLNGAVVVTKAGKPIAALVPIEDMDMETLAVGTSPKFLDIIERSRRRQETEGGISGEQLRRDLGLPANGSRKPKAQRVRTKRTAS
ncbi:MAG: hypothetical protein FJ271_23170 [Planctomycetes bacterium]|nr:hypothetical protein [Planctomycetota bacterium]